MENEYMSRNIETVNAYLDGFRKNDHAQILSCLTDDIEWTVFGAFHLTGKEAYDKAIDGAPTFIDPPESKGARLRSASDQIACRAAVRRACSAHRTSFTPKAIIHPMVATDPSSPTPAMYRFNR